MQLTRDELPPAPSLQWAYFLDVDGTLIHIADRPEAVVVERALLSLIQNLSTACGGAVALVSGRMIVDLLGSLGMPSLPMAGLHGLERRDSTGRRTRHAGAPAAKAAILAALAPVMARHPALLLEDKDLTVALHYRQAPQLASYVHQLMKRLVRESGPTLELQCGKRVVEIKPAGINKGSAVRDFMAEKPFKGRRPVFIGDDLNDEHAFAAVNRLDGISVKVGPGSTCARYRLASVNAVRAWLEDALKADT